MKKKHLLSICIFTFGLLAVLAAISFAVRSPYNSAYNIARTNAKMAAIRAEEPDTLDILFGGNSLVVDGVSPLQLWKDKGYSSYVIADESIRLCDNYEILRECKGLQSPKIFILEADTIFSPASPYRHNYALPTNAIEDVLPVFHYHIFYKTKMIQEQEWEQERLWKGFVPLTHASPHIPDGTYMKVMSSEPIEIDAQNYLEKIRSYCKEEGIELLIMALPSPDGWNLGKCITMTEWGMKNEVPFIDLNLLTDEIGIDWNTDIYDAHVHLNKNGAEKVTDFLAKYLSEYYKLEDHRGDPRYQGFQDALEKTGLNK